MSHPDKKFNNNKRRGSQPKLDEFPEDFDDTFFHNELVETNRRIPVLRNIVYRKVKDAITSRIESYGNGPAPLADKFDVDFPVDGFSEFEWAVVREEVMSQGINATSEFKDEKLFAVHLHIERDISLTMTMKEMEIRDGDASESDSDEEGENCGGDKKCDC